MKKLRISTETDVQSWIVIGDEEQAAVTLFAVARMHSQSSGL